jgi:GT2 family glycosyltransferase
VTETAPFVSVIVPHYNDLANLARCLGALRAQSWPSDRFEVIVADNNSQGGVAAVEAIAPWVRAVAAKEQGAGPARNAGAAVAEGDVLAFIDSDCVPHRDWIAAGVAALEDFDYVGGQIITTIGDLKQLTPSEAYEAVFAFNTRKYVEKDKYSVTGNLFAPRAIFEKVGGFRVGVAEDMEWCWRANAMGYRLGYEEAAIVEHAARREWRELRRKHDRMGREMLRLSSERRGWRGRWLGHAALVAGSPLFHSWRVVTSPRLPGTRAKMLGIMGLVMIRLYRSYSMLALLLRHDIQLGK